MSTALLQQNNALVSYASEEKDSVHIVPECKEDVGRAILSFLDTVTTATGQATFYNTKEEQTEAINAIHDTAFGVNRGLYTIMLLLPGVNDFHIQKGIGKLLITPLPNDDGSFLSIEQEDAAVYCMAANLPPQRLFKAFASFKSLRINNRRTRRLILSSILGEKRLPFWAVKYRKKLKNALRHVWGQKVSAAIRNILSKPSDERNENESRLIKRSINKFTQGDVEEAYEAVCFILGGSAEFKSPRFKAFYDARQDIAIGKDLPFEVLEGIRGRFYDFNNKKDLPAEFSKGEEVSKSKVLELTKARMSTRQKTSLQRTAKKAGVKIEFDPNREDLVRLYVYAMAEGMDSKIRDAVNKKALEIANTFPVRYDKVGIVVDTSGSMYGTDTAKNRPLAIALAMRDILQASALKASVTVPTSGDFDDMGMVKPSGDTELAQALITVLKSEPDVVYILTDGYENAPAGRTNEVIRAVRKLGIDTPVYQVTPVIGSESAGVRRLSSSISPMPVSKPEGIALSMVRAAIGQDMERGILGLLRVALPKLESR